MISSDEMTGIQALERKSADKLMKPGQLVKREFEYIRHGTQHSRVPLPRTRSWVNACRRRGVARQSLIASFDVSSGKIIHESIGQTRTELDFVSHLQQMIEANQRVKKWHLVMDCLNIHVSESLVRWIALIENIPAVTLGKKGQSGCLQSMETRAEFLSNSEHKIVFHYTPKHCSW
ncbi:MAG: transposase [Cyanobacteria bacterium P01_G01_bin.67]